MSKVAYPDVTANTATPARTFAIPEEVRRAAKAPATSAAPYQWIQRMLAIGRCDASIMTWLLTPAG